jgi:hypothetical protein
LFVDAALPKKMNSKFATFHDVLRDPFGLFFSYTLLVFLFGRDHIILCVPLKLNLMLRFQGIYCVCLQGK